MAITAASFVPDQPEQRRVGMANTADNVPASGLKEDHAAFENLQTTHGITGTKLPTSTGAGKGNIRKGLVH